MIKKEDESKMLTRQDRLEPPKERYDIYDQDIVVMFSRGVSKYLTEVDFAHCAWGNLSESMRLDV